jgi:hypothetical protein
MTTPDLTGRALSRSDVETASCLKRFKALHEDGMIDESNESRRGSAFHRIALEEYVPALVEHQTPADHEELVAAFERGIVGVQPSIVDEVHDLIFAWGERFELPLDAFLAAEARQVGRVTWKPDLVLAFAAGTIEEGSLLRVVDLKTWPIILSEDALRRDFQGQVYLWEAQRVWPGFDAYEFQIDAVRFGATTAVRYTAADLDGLGRKVDAVRATIAAARASGTWPAQPGDQCGYCRLACEVADDPRSMTRRILTAAEAAEVAGRLLVKQRDVAADLAALKAWAAIEGPIELNGIEWAHRPRVSRKFPARAVIEAFDASDENVPAPRKPFMISASALSTYITTKKSERLWPRFRAALEALATVHTSTAFGAKKLGDVLDADEVDHGDE